MEHCSSNLAQRIAHEHSYSKLLPFRSSIGAGGQDASFPTVVLFSNRINNRIHVDSDEITIGTKSSLLVSKQKVADGSE